MVAVGDLNICPTPVSSPLPRSCQPPNFHPHLPHSPRTWPCLLAAVSGCRLSFNVRPCVGACLLHPTCLLQLDYPVADLQFFRPSRPDRLWLRRLLHGSTTTGGSNSGGGGGDQSPPAAAAAAAGSNGNGVAGIYGAGASSSNGGSGGILVDTFRAFHPTRQNAFTCWSTATSARCGERGCCPVISCA